MEVSATTKYVRMPASKARDLAAQLKGMPVGQALGLTGVCDRKAASVLHKTLKSAIANAENNARLDVEKLRVKQATIDGGPSMRRYWARARGMARVISRKTCHVHVVLTDDTGE